MIAHRHRRRRIRPDRGARGPAPAGGRRWVGPEEADRVAHRLGLALGLGEEASHENRYHSAEVRRGLLAMLEGLATTGPVVLVFEDLHAAEPLLLDLIERLLREGRRLPLLVVCVARWEFLADRPGWAGGLADAVTFWVEPLALEDAVQLAMEAGDLRHDDAVRVAEHAGGNPFFIVEITGMLLREEDVAAADGARRPRPAAAPDGAGGDRRAHRPLSPAARELVRKASLFARGCSTCPSWRWSPSRAGTSWPSWRTPSSWCPTTAGERCVAFPERRPARRRVREPGQTGAPTAASAAGEPAVRARHAPNATRARSRTTWSRRRSRRST